MTFVIDPDQPFSLGRVKRISVSHRLLLLHGRHLTSFHSDIECVKVLDTYYKLNPFSGWLDTLKHSRKNYMKIRRRLQRRVDCTIYPTYCNFALVLDFALKSTDFVQIPTDVIPHHVSRIPVNWRNREMCFEEPQAFDEYHTSRYFTAEDFSCFLSWFLFFVKEKAEIPVDFLVSDDNAIHSLCTLLHDYRRPKRSSSTRSSGR